MMQRHVLYVLGFDFGLPLESVMPHATTLYGFGYCTYLHHLTDIEAKQLGERL